MTSGTSSFTLAETFETCHPAPSDKVSIFSEFSQRGFTLSI